MKRSQQSRHGHCRYLPLRPRGFGGLFCLLLAGAFLAAGLTGCGRDEPPLDESSILIWGSRGRDPGEFYKPRGITATPDGDLIVIDRSGRIQELDGDDGHQLASWNLPACTRGTPTGLGFDTQGNLLVADTHYFRVLVYSPDHELLSTFGEFGDDPGQFGYVTDVAVDHDGSIYTSEYDEMGNCRIQKFAPDYSFVRQWGTQGTGPGEFQRPMAIVCDATGLLYVADSVNHRIQKFDSDGNFVEMWGDLGDAPGQLRYPYDLVFDDNDRLYVMEYGNHRIQAFTTHGVSLGTFGEPGRKPGQFSSPWGLAFAPPGRLYCADTENHRIQVLSVRLIS